MIECPNCQDFTNPETGFCHTCQTQTVHPGGPITIDVEDLADIGRIPCCGDPDYNACPTEEDLNKWEAIEETPPPQIDKHAKLKALAKEALEIQDASNLCGLAQRFAKVNKELRECYDGGTDAWNQHPIIILWLDKFNSLARIQFDPNNITKAYDAVYELLGE